MKKIIYYLTLALATGMIFAGCGGSGDSSSSSGTISMNITDAKPTLPTGVQQVLIQIDEVSVHKSGGGWTSFALPQTPFIIDLLQFNEGKTTQLVPPALLSSGKYTQVRIGVKEAWIVINGDKKPLDIPSDNLKTDKNFDFNVEEDTAVDLTVDFDLSQSIVQTAPDTYQLKPVLHLLLTAEAWTIKGNITSSKFDSIPDPKEAVVIVYRNLGDIELFEGGVDEEYTRLTVTKEEGTDADGTTGFSVFWLVPDQNYYVEVYLGDPTNPATQKYFEFVDASQWGTSKTFSLREGASLF